ncbi:MAG: acetate/propionate family kinase [Janthinobacterium lividum]
MVLALNSGSSSLKYGLYRTGRGRPALLVGGTIETIDDHGASFDAIAADLARADAPAPTIVAHRIVHGGPHRTAHCPIDAAAMRDLEAACAFAPLHGPAALALIRVAQARFPGLPQVACFDTAFHSTMPEIATTLPIPRAYGAEGVRRYGSHGLSCASIVRQLGDALPPRLVIAHLGSGASVTAARHGRSVDTSMGLTPSGGVVMATRTGDVDPGVLLYLLRGKGLDAAALAGMVDHASGMLGVSGLSGDMRQLRAAAATNEAAALAAGMFARSISKMIAAMAASLGGVDLIVLTGGIGENDADTGRAIRADLAWIAGAQIRTMPSREDEEIALAAASLA